MLGIRAQILGIRVQIAAPRVLGCKAGSEGAQRGISRRELLVRKRHLRAARRRRQRQWTVRQPSARRAARTRRRAAGGRRQATGVGTCACVCVCVRVAAETPASLRELLQPLLARVVARCCIPAVGVAGSWRRCDGSGQTWPRRKGAYELLDGFSAAPSADASCRAAGACVSERSSVHTGTCLCVCASV